MAQGCLTPSVMIDLSVSGSHYHEEIARLQPIVLQAVCVFIRINHPRSLACTPKDSSPRDYRVALPTPVLSPTTIPHRKSLGYRTLEEHAREGFTSEVMCLTLSPASLYPSSDRVPSCVHVYPTITGKKPWSTPSESQQTFTTIRREFGGQTLDWGPHRGLRGGGGEHNLAERVVCINC